jgi:hypothetical protein
VYDTAIFDMQSYLYKHVAGHFNSVRKLVTEYKMNDKAEKNIENYGMYYSLQNGYLASF